MPSVFNACVPVIQYSRAVFDAFVNQLKVGPNRRSTTTGLVNTIFSSGARTFML
jgi:hypothetical protein